ncbi:hypothetical protein [Pseudoalteromonas luteoviolacea]|uniref:Uncharacterized protein n=1 Tax=Pseudoalteromonas luteoviolacea (strain 2ta16) TaxID=1353533 RepID=V4HV26_PSEL2|nr:hypothetical protein [Pseudoalteromonas luteoviolacea]ESP91774.1 hypothetical protein PL2TA16_05415 [Pseudoalteromonas luteoviolacea 2ta16]KZN40747.1 hypothetical protein N483_16595 [Pseudoalteromonas luteoviolacea NCIMB 1944]
MNSPFRTIRKLQTLGLNRCDLVSDGVRTNSPSKVSSIDVQPIYSQFKEGQQLTISACISISGGNTAYKAPRTAQRQFGNIPIAIDKLK